LVSALIMAASQAWPCGLFQLEANISGSLYLLKERAMAAAAASEATRRGLTEAGQGYRGPDGHIGFLLRQAQTAVRGAIERAIQPLGVTPAQLSLLSVLVHEGIVSSADLAKLAMMTAQSAGGIVQNMERAGWVTRQKARDHGRIIWLKLTPAGRRIAAQAQKRAGAIEREMLRGVDGATETAIRHWLVACAKRLGPDRSA
jgi:DNA-binding MarR family transcriptional regulator